MDDENIYGAGAITGSKEDAAKDPLAGRDVAIKTGSTSTVNLKTESTADAAENKSADEQGNQQETDVTPEQKLEGDIKNQIQAEADIAKDLETKGVDFNALASEYEADGKLSEETLEKLTKAGYPKSAVDAYISGMEANAARFEQQVYDYAGGKEAFTRLTQFVQAQGSQAISTFNTVLNTGDLGQIRLALQGFQAQMGQKFGTQNQTLMGKPSSQTEVQGFASKQEMVTAMSDKRYGRDPGYTKEVQQKTIRSTFM